MVVRRIIAKCAIQIAALVSLVLVASDESFIIADDAIDIMSNIEDIQQIHEIEYDINSEESLYSVLEESAVESAMEGSVDSNMVLPKVDVSMTETSVVDIPMTEVPKVDDSMMEVPKVDVPVIQKSSISVLNNTQTSEYKNIGIGGGGSFYRAVVNPLNGNNFVVSCDMGGIYTTASSGDKWIRNNCSTSRVLHYANDGTLFVGGYGLHMSSDNGNTLDMIYPKEEDIKYVTTWFERYNPMIVADNYDNGYIAAIDTFKDNLYFVSINWASKDNLKICRSLHDGSAFEVLKSYTVDYGPFDVQFRMVAENDFLLYSDGQSIWKLDCNTSERSCVYNARGKIKDFQKIGDQYYILDDIPTETLVLATKDFCGYSNINQFNTLGRNFTRGGKDHTLEWHYNHIRGNNEGSIWLSFDSAIKGNQSLGGILKFDGTKFVWVIDAIFTRNAAGMDSGWTYGDLTTPYDLCADPNNDNRCIFVNDVAAFEVYYESESNRYVKILHCSTIPVNGDLYYATKGLDVQVTYAVRENPFNSNNIIICTTDMGLQISYDGGRSFRKNKTVYEPIYNTCYDLAFDPYVENIVYGLWSSRHNAPTYPKLADANAVGGFGISYDGGITWNFDYSSGIPLNSIPVKMSIVESDNHLIIAVATFNNGFYLSFDSGRTFICINDGMDSYPGMIWGADVEIVGDDVYCLTANSDSDGVVPSKVYRYNISSKKTVKLDTPQELIVGRSLTYREAYGLLLNALPYYNYEYISNLDKNYYVNRGGGVYRLNADSFDMFIPIEYGSHDCCISSDDVIYITGQEGNVYTFSNGKLEIVSDSFFPRLLNVCLSENERLLYVTTMGGGTYCVPIDSRN